jgi:outer membrane protein assembly factor BamB
MYCLNVDDGSIRWSFLTGGMIKCLAGVTDTSVIFGSYDKFVYSVSIESGKLVSML